METLKGNDFYVGQRTFNDRTASLALNHVRSEQRLQGRLQRDAERDAKRERDKISRRAGRERLLESLDPINQRIVEIQRTIGTFHDQVRLGEIDRRGFKEVTKPLRRELSQLTRS